MLKKKVKEKVVRSNNGIWPHQDEYIKEKVKKSGNTQGEVFREMLQYYIDNHPLK